VYRRTEWSRVAPNGQRIIHFSIEKGMKIISKGHVFIHKRIISAVRTVWFVSDRSQGGEEVELLLIPDLETR
jgi:hypothetical protein